MTIGIYRLVFKGTDKCYIGQTISLEKRLYSHISIIKAGKGATKLSNAFREYGVPELEVLVECTKEELDTYENEAIEIFNSVEEGFNTLSKAGEIPKPDNTGEKNGSSIYTNEEIEHIFLKIYSLIDSRPTDISSILELPISLVNVIINGINHTWLEGIFPIEYNNMINRKGTRSNGKSAKDRGIQYPTIISPGGEEFIVDNIRQFALLNNLDRGCLNRLLNNKAKSHKGWKLKV